MMKKSAQDTDSAGNVWSSANHDMHEGTDSLPVRDGGHVGDLFRGGWAIEKGQGTRILVHRGGGSSRILTAEPVKNRIDIVSLLKYNGMSRPITMQRDPKDALCLPEVGHFVLRHQLFLDRLNCCQRLGSNQNIVNINSDELQCGTFATRVQTII
jgi:hypothetical protein